MSSVQSQLSLPGIPDSISLSFPDEAGMLVQTWNCIAIPQKNQELQTFHSTFSYKTTFWKTVFLKISVLILKFHLPLKHS